MVIHETLRLYPPATFVSRNALKNIDLGKVFIPKGTTVAIPILALHHDPFLWGPDVNEFNPDRFAHGIANACKHPMAFIPFVAGPRVCVDQTFAVMEAKIVLAIILSRFKFHLSPNYIHNRTSKLTLRPHHGMPLIFERTVTLLQKECLQKFCAFLWNPESCICLYLEEGQGMNQMRQDLPKNWLTMAD